MSRLFTVADLQYRTDQALRGLFREIETELARTAPSSAARRNALASLENISRVLNRRRMTPRPPGF